MVSSWKLCQKTISVRLVEMLKDQGVKNNGLTFLEEINSEWVSRSRLKVHPQQQILEARVVRRHIIPLIKIGHATPPETKSRLEERSLN
jgi:hypothetical protein